MKFEFNQANKIERTSQLAFDRLEARQMLTGDPVNANLQKIVIIDQQPIVCEVATHEDADSGKTMDDVDGRASCVGTLSLGSLSLDVAGGLFWQGGGANDAPTRFVAGGNSVFDSNLPTAFSQLDEIHGNEISSGSTAGSETSAAAAVEVELKPVHEPAYQTQSEVISGNRVFESPKNLSGGPATISMMAGALAEGRTRVQTLAMEANKHEYFADALSVSVSQAADDLGKLDLNQASAARTGLIDRFESTSLIAHTEAGLESNKVAQHRVLDQLFINSQNESDYVTEIADHSGVENRMASVEYLATSSNTEPHFVGQFDSNESGVSEFELALSHQAWTPFVFHWVSLPSGKHWAATNELAISQIAKPQEFLLVNADQESFNHDFEDVTQSGLDGTFKPAFLVTGIWTFACLEKRDRRETRSRNLNQQKVPEAILGMERHR